MKVLSSIPLILCLVLTITSCVPNKKFLALERVLEERTVQAESLQASVGECNAKLSSKEKTIALEKAKQEKLESEINSNEQLINTLNSQIFDLKKQRDQQVTQVGDLTVLSKSANDNMGQTIRQLERKDEYIRLLNLAKNKADSLNLALAFNLKSVLAEGIADEDIDVQIDKTVVFINLSDKMLYNSGSSDISSRANEVLEKIAQIISSRPELEVMVEGYTDSNPINNSCVKDNWDLSVKRATSVVRSLQEQYGVDPNRLIAAGRGQYNSIADNETDEGRSTNRRTRIIILPKLNQFYDLLKPDLAGK